MSAQPELLRVGTFLEAAGVSPDLVRAHLDDIARQVTSLPEEERATASHDLWAARYKEGFPALSALVAGTRVPFGTYPTIDLLVASCATVGEGFGRLGRYFGILRGDCRFDIDEHGDTPTVTMVDQHRHDDWFFDEWTVGVTLRGFRHAAGDRFVPKRIEVRRADAAAEPARRPAEHAAGCPIVLGASHARFVFDREAWEAPLVSGDPRLRTVLERHAEELLDERLGERATTRAVRGALLGLLGAGEPSIQLAGKKLGMSPRTLQRQLAAEGTTYQEVLDALRAELAERHLARGIGVSEVAFLLGYADGSAFARAFRRWYGRAPTEASLARTQG